MKHSHLLMTIPLLVFGSAVLYVSQDGQARSSLEQQTPNQSSQNTIDEIQGKARILVKNVEHAVKEQSKINDDELNKSAPPLVQAARKQIGVTKTYNPAYVKLDYPMGDVPQEMGVCTDVVIRAYRQQGKDLQVLVNRDMKKVWSQYPKIWGLKSTDKNIDHRRVPNLRVFFSRHGKKLKVTDNSADYKAGDIVTWSVNNLPHIGIVSNKKSYDGVPYIIHNIGRGTREENILFNYKITGHYSF